MNRQAREDFGFWASDDYALMGRSGKGKVDASRKEKKKRGGSGSTSSIASGYVAGKATKTVYSGVRVFDSGEAPSLPSCDPCTIS